MPWLPQQVSGRKRLQSNIGPENQDKELAGIQ
jgi:hypothetical protein